MGPLGWVIGADVLKRKERMLLRSQAFDVRPCGKKANLSMACTSEGLHIFVQTITDLLAACEGSADRWLRLPLFTSDGTGLPAGI